MTTTSATSTVGPSTIGTVGPEVHHVRALQDLQAATSSVEGGLGNLTRIGELSTKEYAVTRKLAAHDRLVHQLDAAISRTASAEPTIQRLLTSGNGSNGASIALQQLRDARAEMDTLYEMSSRSGDFFKYRMAETSAEKLQSVRSKMTESLRGLNSGRVAVEQGFGNVDPKLVSAGSLRTPPALWIGAAVAAALVGAGIVATRQ